MQEAGYTQNRLAIEVGVSQGAIQKISGGQAKSTTKLLQIAKALGVNAEWLGNGIGPMRTQAHHNVAGKWDNVSYDSNYQSGKVYPLISSVRAGAWSEANEPYTLEEVAEWYESTSKVQGEGFWLRVEGDSMTAPAGLSIPENTLVLFDTGREPVNGSLVIAKLTDSNEATFKKLIIDGGLRFLRGLNPAWPLMPINGNCKIIGVAIETKMLLP